MLLSEHILCASNYTSLFVKLSLQVLLCNTFNGTILPLLHLTEGALGAPESLVCIFVFSHFCFNSREEKESTMVIVPKEYNFRQKLIIKVNLS